MNVTGSPGGDGRLTTLHVVEGAAEFADKINAWARDLKRGSLIVYGDIFAGRIDNIHIVVSATARPDDSLVVRYLGCLASACRPQRWPIVITRRTPPVSDVGVDPGSGCSWRRIAT